MIAENGTSKKDGQQTPRIFLCPNAMLYDRLKKWTISFLNLVFNNFPQIPTPTMIYSLLSIINLSDLQNEKKRLGRFSKQLSGKKAVVRQFELKTKLDQKSDSDQTQIRTEFWNSVQSISLISLSTKLANKLESIYLLKVYQFCNQFSYK